MYKFSQGFFKVLPLFIKINTGMSLFFIFNIFFAYYIFEEDIRKMFKKTKKVYFWDVIGVDEYI